MDSIIVTHINSKSPLYPQVLNLREEVLRKPLGLSLKNEDLSRDHIDTIFIATLDDNVIACLLLHHIDNDVVQLRAMAVCKNYQGTGIGKMLVMAAEKFSLQRGYKEIMLHSRKVAMGFYQSMSYKVSGEEFIEVGIPHFVMEKKLG